MGKKIFILLFVASIFVLSSCCKNAMEIGNYKLTDNQAAFIPYKTGESYNYMKSDSSEFFLYVLSVQTETTRTFTDHCSDDYYVYEYKSAQLGSTDPKLSISLMVFPQEYNSLMSFQVNNTYFILDTKELPSIDTISINGIVYDSVYLLSREDSDPGTVNPKKIFYNKKVGILKIVFTNDEFYSLY
jgi:hypothetical protein